MKRDQGFMTPISTLFMVIVIAPYVGMRFGRLSIFFLSPLIAYTFFLGYRHYKKKAAKNRISYAEALEEDLPDMSPLHFVFFILLIFPLLLYISGGEMIALSGIAVLWLVYAIYYYGFRKKGD